jgi:hypothetical protein
MNATVHSTQKTILMGLSWLLFVIAGLAILVAGSAISDFGKVDRTLAEVVGDAGALLIAGLGYMVKRIAGDLGETEDSSGRDE